VIVVGAGRVGTALKQRSDEVDIDCDLVSRDSGWQALDGAPGDPILLTVRNDDLDEVLKKVPKLRRPDLVFIQNGGIREWLRGEYLHQCTRGLLYFAVKTRGGPIEPGPTSPFCGPHAHILSRWFGLMKLPAEEVNWARFSNRELEKLIWNSSFGVLCELYDCDVGTVCTEHRAELIALVDEFRVVGRMAMGVEIPLDWLVNRLVDYSMTISDYRASVKEWQWRNGWFEAAAVHYGYPMILHKEMVTSIGKSELLSD